MADPRVPLVEVETLKPPSAYPHRQLAGVFFVAYCCREAFGSVRFVYALPPDAA